MSTARDRSDLLLHLAHSPSSDDRERLLFALIELCEGEQAPGPPGLPAAEAAMRGLLAMASPQARERAAERLAHAHSTPAGLAMGLAHEEIGIARPLIRHSPALDGDALRQLIVDGSPDHRWEIAQRPGLSAACVEALLDVGDTDALSALAANRTAEITPEAMERLVAASERSVALRAPLARHPALSSAGARALYTWCGEGLRRALARRFKEVGDFERSAIRAVAASGGREERAGMDAILVKKLRAAGRLGPGLLVRALQEGQLALFCVALCELGGYDRTRIRRALDAGGSDLLALACAGVGVDRSALPDLLALARRLNAGRPGTAEGDQALSGLDALLQPHCARETFLGRSAPV